MGKWINIDDLPSDRVEWEDIFDAPTIDIVRCKECVFRNQKYLCQVIETDDDDFCSYGVKKGADDESVDSN